MPSGRRPVALIPVGYPEKVTEQTSRKAINEVVEFYE